MHVMKCDGAYTQPCLTAVFTWKKLDTSPPHFTPLIVPEYRSVNIPIFLPKNPTETQKILVSLDALDAPPMQIYKNKLK